MVLSMRVTLISLTALFASCLVMLVVERDTVTAIVLPVRVARRRELPDTSCGQGKARIYILYKSLYPHAAQILNVKIHLLAGGRAADDLDESYDLG